MVSAKPPFADPEQVLGYLGRYTHRVAIANGRLVALDDSRVDFTWKDYRHGKTKIMTLSADEFIRRFLQHTVPDGFHRIRHIGFLANRHRSAKLARCRQLLAAPPPEPLPARRWQDRLRELTGQDIDVCPCCCGQMPTCASLPRCPPPRPPSECITAPPLTPDRHPRYPPSQVKYPYAALARPRPASVQPSFRRGFAPQKLSIRCPPSSSRCRRPC